MDQSVAAELDADIRGLLFERVGSFEELEALLLLRRAASGALSAPEVAAALRIEAAAAARALNELAAHRLLALEESSEPRTYRYAADCAQADQAVGRLAQLYAEQPLAVIRQMSANAVERLRSSAARAFSDAFIFRGRKP